LETTVKWFIVLLIAATAPMGAIGQERGSQADYRRDAAAARILVERAVSIKTGDSRKTVIDKLGSPDEDSVLMRKEKPEIIGRSMRYDIVRWKRGLVNELHDQYVNVHLDSGDVVKSLVIRVTLEGK
jgi:hypothetical protein